MSVLEPVRRFWRPRLTWLRLVALAVVVLLVVGLVAWVRSWPPSLTAVPLDAATALKPPASDPASQAQYASFYQQQPLWSACGAKAPQAPATAQCALVQVPRDWHQPQGPTVQLQVGKIPATGHRIGSLVFNPGGPGVPGLTYLGPMARVLGEQMRSSYDIVTWDTRGVGLSHPITCLTQAEVAAGNETDASPDTPAELSAAMAESDRYRRGCQQASNEGVAEHMGTAETVADLDVIRAVLGQAQLTFIGSSYGTYLGATYAQTYPWRVGRMVLDGAIDPTLTAAQYVQGQAMGFSRAQTGFVQWCVQRGSCPLGSDVAAAQQKLGELFAATDSQPVPTTSGRPLTQSLFTIGLLNALYSPQRWESARTALAQVLAGHGDALLASADEYLQRNPDGTYSQLMQAVTPTLCEDRPDQRTAAQVEMDAKVVGAQYPPFGASIAFGALSCVGWAPPAGGAITVAGSMTGMRPILVVGTTGDPATPYEWAQGAAKQLPNAVLLTRRGEGHTAFGQGNTCVDTAVVRYLLTGTVPTHTQC